MQPTHASVWANSELYHHMLSHAAISFLSMVYSCNLTSYRISLVYRVYIELGCSMKHMIKEGNSSQSCQTLLFQDRLQALYLDN